jgi:hypothetical protein
MQVGVQGMVWKPGKFAVAPAIVSFGKRNAQYFTGINGILAKCFVKVADPE